MKKLINRHNQHNGATRSFGILEKILAKKRADVEVTLIEKGKRDGKILDIGCGSFPYFLSKVEFKQYPKYVSVLFT